MGCVPCGQGRTGLFEVVLAEGTVPAQVAGQENNFATAHAAQTALNAAGTGGYVRARRQAATV